VSLYPHKITLRNNQGRLVNKLAEDLALAEQAAGWSIYAWAYALKIKEDLQDSARDLVEKGKTLADRGEHEEALFSEYIRMKKMMKKMSGR